MILVLIFPFRFSRLQTLEQSNVSLKEEAARCRSELEVHRKEKERLKECLEESQLAVTSLQDEVHTLREQERRYKEEKTVAEQVHFLLRKVFIYSE